MDKPKYKLVNPAGYPDFNKPELNSIIWGYSHPSDIRFPPYTYIHTSKITKVLETGIETLNSIYEFVFEDLTKKN